jgi:hypothetical protein
MLVRAGQAYADDTSVTGYISPWTGRFYSLWDTGYAKIHIPIIASVSEHQPTTWVSFFFDLHILACVFPVGLWYCVKNVNDARVFSECLYVCLHTCMFSHSVRGDGCVLCRRYGTTHVDAHAVCVRPCRHCLLAHI